MKAKLNPALWDIDAHEAGGKRFTHDEPTELTAGEWADLKEQKVTSRGAEHDVLVAVEEDKKATTGAQQG